MPLTSQQSTKLAAHVWSHDHATFALLDGAGIPNLLDKLYGTAGLEFECLYSGELEDGIAEAAPYIARLRPDTDFANWVLGGWGEHRNMFVQVQEDVALPLLRRHFRKLNTVYGPEARPLVFRYYDPRVMRMYMSTATQEEIKTIFGPVSRYVMERPRRGGVTVSERDGELAQEVFSVA
jgi:hypothetical protein